MPDDTEKIIIQLEGNYFEAFYEQGRKRINTMNQETKRLDIVNNKNVFILYKENFTENTLSFAFKPKDYFSIIFSYYYFRVLHTKAKETKYLPLDSNLGNLCLPEKDSSSETYNCYLKLKNDYNELKNKFVIASENQNEFFKINISKIYKNKKSEIKQNSTFLYYVYEKIEEDIDFLLFEFGFENDEIKNIISSFLDNIENIYPQVYSSQIYYLDHSNKIANFKLGSNNYLFNYQFICGETGFLYNSLPYFEYIYMSQTFFGLPLIFPLNSDNSHQYLFSTNSSMHIFNFQPIYNMKSKGIEEVKEGEPLTQILNEIIFPIYYYIKIKGNGFINMDVNLRLINYALSELNSNYNITGYIVDYDIINKKVNGENVELDKFESFSGNYIKSFGFGFLQVRKYIDNNKTDKYILIEINNVEKRDINFSESYSIMEISAKKYVKNSIYTLPTNKYLLETFDDENNTFRDNNDYKIFNHKGNTLQTLIEISTESKEINITFSENISYFEDKEFNTGFKKYIINNSDYEILSFNVTNPNKIKANYMIRYYFTDIRYKKLFIFDGNYSIKVNNNTVNNNVDISLEFKCIKVNSISTTLLEKGVYFVITGTLYKENEVSDINTNYILNDRKSTYVNKTIVFYSSNNQSNWTLEFKNLPRKNDTYDLQLQIDSILLYNILSEEFLLYKAKINVNVGELIEEGNNNFSIFWIIGPIIGVIILIAVFFVIKFFRLKKANNNLQNEIKSLAFSNNIKQNVLINEQKISKKESDYEYTFI